MSLKRLKESFRHAFRGIAFVWKREQNFRIQVIIGIIILILAILFNIGRGELVVVFLLIFWVLILELLNSILEHFIDLLKPRLHHQVSIIKDILAGMVLCSVIGSTVIGMIIFWPYIKDFFIN